MAEVKHIKVTQTGGEDRPFFINPLNSRLTVTVPSVPWIDITMSTVDSEGAIHMHIENRKVLDDRVTKAYNEFMVRLFGTIPSHPNELFVDKEVYTKEMHTVQERYGLTQGTPDFLEWVLTLVGRSPVLTSEGEIVYDTGAKGHPAASEEPAVGEAPSSQTE
jgi:hypothetical protein